LDLLPAERGTATSVPFVDLAPANELVREGVLADLDRLIRSGAFINGHTVGAFEEQFAEYCGVAFCVGVASGLDALRLALIASGAEGGEVVVPALTFAATFEAIVQAGATPRVVDVTEHDYNIDPAALDAAISSRTRAVLPVHLYGQLADMRAIREIADEHRLDVVEDACQAHGAVRDDIRSGTSSKAAAFSFYPTKNLGAFGDAGALVTGDETLAGRVRSLREHGQVTKYRHSEVGYTARLDAVQAAVLARKLVHLDDWSRAGGRGSVLLARARRSRRSGAATRARGEFPRLAPVRGSHRRAGAPCRLSCRPQDRHGTALSGTATPRAGVRRARLRARGVPNKRGDRA
jgi:dTDP-4-amino-4,6-dideoxygalactose transaminase